VNLATNQRAQRRDRTNVCMCHLDHLLQLPWAHCRRVPPTEATHRYSTSGRAVRATSPRPWQVELINVEVIIPDPSLALIQTLRRQIRDGGLQHELTRALAVCIVHRRP
jgi:hypothetical protein